MNYKARSLLNWILPLSVLILLLGAWESALMFDKDKSLYLIPRIPVVVKELGGNLELYFSHGFETFIEAIVGFVLGNAISFLLAVWMSYSRRVEKLVYPYAIALKATPIVALAPLIVAWFGLDFASKVVCAAVVSFFPLIVQLPDAFRRVPQELLDLFHSMGATEKQIFIQLRLPLASPQIFAALKTASSLSVVGALVGEFISPTGGVGRLLIQALANGLAGQLVAATVVASGIGLLFFGALHLAQRRLIHWESQTV